MNTNINNIVKMMNEYVVLGMSPMPVKGKKATTLKWQKKSAADMIKEFKKKDAGENLAIRTGFVSKCMVVDVDVKNRGLEVWKKLEELHGVINTYRVSTPSGGLHVYLNYEGTQEIGNLVDCIKQCDVKVSIDIRNDNGYVVAPPSTFNGKPYVAEIALLPYLKTRGNQSIFASIPLWLKQLLNGSILDKDYNIVDPKRAAIANIGNDDDDVDIANANDNIDNIDNIDNVELIQQGITIESVKAFVDCLSLNRAENRNDWRNVVWALKHAGVQYKLKDKDIKALAHVFSKKSDKYDKNEVDDLLQNESLSIKAVTLGTIRFMAKQDDPEKYCDTCRGISFCTKESDSSWNDLSDIRTSKPTLSALMQFYQSCVYEVNSGSLSYFAKMRNGSIQSIQKPFVSRGEDFNVPLTPEGSISMRAAFETISCSKVWRKNTYDNVDFMPSFTEMVAKDRVLNLFTGFPCKPIAGESEHSKIIEWHIEHILCAGNALFYEMMCNWLAHFAQKPGIKIEIMPMFLGEQGTGKSIVFDKLFPLLVSEQHYHEIDDMNILFDKFNGDQKNKMLCVLNEIGTWGPNQGNSGKLKSVMTRKKMKIENKGMDRYEVSDTCNYILATNKDNPVRIEISNRRYAPITVSSEKIGDINYFSKLEAAINSDSVGRLLHKWLARDISNWRKSEIPRTDALISMKNIGFSPAIRFLLEIASLQTTLIENDALRAHTCSLYAHFTSWCTDNKEVVLQQKVFAAELVKTKIPYGNVRIDGLQKKGFSITLKDLQSLLKLAIREPEWNFDEPELPDL